MPPPPGRRGGLAARGIYRLLSALRTLVTLPPVRGAVPPGNTVVARRATAAESGGRRDGDRIRRVCSPGVEARAPLDLRSAGRLGEDQGGDPGRRGGGLRLDLGLRP